MFLEAAFLTVLAWQTCSECCKRTCDISPWVRVCDRPSGLFSRAKFRSGFRIEDGFRHHRRQLTPRVLFIISQAFLHAGAVVENWRRSLPYALILFQALSSSRILNVCTELHDFSAPNILLLVAILLLCSKFLLSVSQDREPLFFRFRELLRLPSPSSGSNFSGRAAAVFCVYPYQVVSSQDRFQDW